MLDVLHLTIHITVKTSSNINKFNQTDNDKRSFMQIKWTSGQLVLSILLRGLSGGGGCEGSIQETGSFWTFWTGFSCDDSGKGYCRPKLASGRRWICWVG